MVSKEKGKLYYINHMPWIVIESDSGNIVNRKVLSINKENKTCEIKMDNVVKEVEYYI